MVAGETDPPIPPRILTLEPVRAALQPSKVRVTVSGPRTQPKEDLTVSVGVATFSSSVSTLTDLIREADNALYRAKKRGRNRVEG